MVRDPALSLLWYGFIPGPGTSACCWQGKKKKEKKKINGKKNSAMHSLVILKSSSQWGNIGFHGKESVEQSVLPLWH